MRLTGEEPVPLQKQNPNLAVAAYKPGEDLLTSATLLQMCVFAWP